MKNRVRIPSEKAALVTLVQKVRARHEAEGESSPLKVLNWESINALIDEAAELEKQAQELKRAKLSVFERRKQKKEQVQQLARSIRDVLSGVHLTEKKKLGLWGFDVLDERVTRQREQPAEKVNG